jgi:hypothetical protein
MGAVALRSDQVLRRTEARYDSTLNGMDEVIRSLINAYISGTSGVPWERELARRLDALPLYSDLTVLWMLSADGEVLAVLHDEKGAEPRKETDERLRNLALFQGSRRWPALGYLVPERTDESVTCESCESKGLAAVPTHLQNKVVCWCGGLGWVPRTAPMPKATVADDATNISGRKPTRWLSRFFRQR